MTEPSPWSDSAPGRIVCDECGASWFCHFLAWTAGGTQCPVCAERALTWDTVETPADVPYFQDPMHE